MIPLTQAQGLWAGETAKPHLGSALSSQGLIDHHHLLQERLAVLDSQAGQIRAQAVQESERLARDKNASLQLLQKVAPVTWVGEVVGEWEVNAEGLGWRFASHVGSPFAWSPPLPSFRLLSDFLPLWACRRRRN